MVNWSKSGLYQLPLRSWSSMPIMENSSLLFSSCHLKLVILGNNRLLLENSQLFAKITSKKLTFVPEQPVTCQNCKLLMTREILPVTIFKIVDSRRSGPKGPSSKAPITPTNLQNIRHWVCRIALVLSSSSVKSNMFPVSFALRNSKLQSQTQEIYGWAETDIFGASLWWQN